MKWMFRQMRQMIVEILAGILPLSALVLGLALSSYERPSQVRPAGEGESAPQTRIQVPQPPTRSPAEFPGQ
ncbi:MAG TPA: hypothetical protein VLU25_21970 [Acidobacteriota bacterium]|nr:hypothetical protein [Acidobacteriota bacterium]